jgi:hypothetical protein
MDAFEAAMTKDDEQARRDLEALATLVPSNPDGAAAASSYARFGEFRKQILKLSRDNTNLRCFASPIEDQTITGIPAEHPR